MTTEDSELLGYALTGIRAQIADLQEKERILEAQFRLKRWGKKKNMRFRKHDEPGLPQITRETIARTHDVTGGALLEQRKRKKRKRRLSAAGRKAISDAAKARWAREKLAEEQQSSSRKKK